MNEVCTIEVHPGAQEDAVRAKLNPLDPQNMRPFFIHRTYEEDHVVYANMHCPPIVYAAINLHVCNKLSLLIIKSDSFGNNYTLIFDMTFSISDLEKILLPVNTFFFLGTFVARKKLNPGNSSIRERYVSSEYKLRPRRYNPIK